MSQNSSERHAISVRDLTYTYPSGDAPAVRDVSFGVEAGWIFGLLGPSGAGKSTIQRVLTRQARRFHGAVHALGRNLADWDWRYYERIGVGFELPNHYLKLTAAENLRFFASLYPGRTPPPEAILEMVGLEDAAKVRVAEFSKGMMCGSTSSARSCTIPISSSSTSRPWGLTRSTPTAFANWSAPSTARVRPSC